MGWHGHTDLVDSLKTILNVILHQIIAVVLVYSVWGPLLNGGQLSWHVILCTVGLLPFMVEAMLLFGDDNFYVIDFERSTKIWIHAVLAILGSTFIIAGVCMEIARQDKQLVGSHFSTTHGIVGLTCFIFLLISILLGFPARFAKPLRGYVKPVISTFAHNIVGIITYILAFASICTGYYSDLFIASDESKLAATIVNSIICGWTLIFSLMSLYKQIEKLF